MSILIKVLYIFFLNNSGVVYLCMPLRGGICADQYVLYLERYLLHGNFMKCFRLVPTSASYLLLGPCSPMNEFLDTLRETLYAQKLEIGALPSKIRRFCLNISYIW